MKPIQNAGPAQALADGLGIKGMIRLGVDDIIVPTVQVADFDVSPYSQAHPVGGARSQAAAGAGQFSMCGISPGRGTILGVHRVTSGERNAGAGTVALRWLSPAELAAITVNTTIQARDFNHELIGGTLASRGALLFAAEHNATVGITLELARIPQDETGVFKFPRGFYLYGDDPQGVGAIVVSHTTANLTTDGNFYCTEYRLKG